MVACVAWVYLRHAMDVVQPFYAAATQADPQQLKSAGRRLEHRVTKLREESKPSGSWQTVFTDEEVNGWLAVILEEKHADLLPPSVTDPRVAFTAGGCQVGYRYQGRQFAAIVSVEGDAFMAFDDVAAVRLRRARFGGLPLPMSSVVDEVSKAAVKLAIPVRWTEIEDDPVLLVSVADALSTDEERRQMERLELRDGELLLAGRTAPRPSLTPAVATQTPSAPGR